MNQSQVCLPGFSSDIALTLMLKSWELKSFLYLLDFASTGRDPWVIPASKRLRLRLAMKLGRDEEKFQKRLAVFAGDADLIELRADGSIFLKYLEEQYEEEGDGGSGNDGDGELAPFAPRTNGNGSGGPRQPGRRYSDDPEAQRKREYRHGRQRRTDTPENSNVPANVPSFESKCPTPDADTAPQMSQLGRDILPGYVRDIPHARADSRSMPEEEITVLSSLSGIESVAEMSHVPANVPPQGASIPPRNVPGARASAAAPPPGSSPAARMPSAPENPALAPEITRHRRNSAVRDVLKFTGDDSSARDLWVKLWNICDEGGHLPVWDEAIRLLAKEIKQGREPIKIKGAWLQSKLRRLLEAKDVFVPTKAELEAEAPEDIRGQIRASLGSVTPLDELYDPEDVTDGAVGAFEGEEDNG